MHINIDARGLACPKPVIHTKKELDKDTTKIVIVTVDNQPAKQNILKLSNKMKYNSEVINEEENEIVIQISKGDNDVDTTVISEDSKKESLIEDRYIFISSDKMGQGNDELGKVLINGFIYALTETKPYPKYIIFVNSGVRLTTENEATIENLKFLESQGSEILTCGTCLDYYDLKEELKVGSISNMYTILESMKECSSNISI